MSRQETYTTEQRLTGAFVDVNTCASMVLEMLEAMRDPEPVDGSRLEAMAAHVVLMVRRIGYVNQVAAHLACPGLMDAPDWSNWMDEPSACLRPFSGKGATSAGAGAGMQIGGRA